VTCALTPSECLVPLARSAVLQRVSFVLYVIPWGGYGMWRVLGLCRNVFGRGSRVRGGSRQTECLGLPGMPRCCGRYWLDEPLMVGPRQGPKREPWQPVDEARNTYGEVRTRKASGLSFARVQMCSIREL
jgi:hypothetical protein